MLQRNKQYKAVVYTTWSNIPISTDTKGKLNIDPILVLQWVQCDFVEKQNMAGEARRAKFTSSLIVCISNYCDLKTVLISFLKFLFKCVGCV